LLQAAKRVEIALGVLERAARFDQLRIDGENFFVCTAGGEVSLIGLGGFHQSLRAGRLAAQVGIIELQKQLAFADVIAFLDKQALHRGGDGRVGFEIPNGFYFAIGGNQTADGSALDGCGADLQRGRASEKWNRGQGGDHADSGPSAASARRGTSIRIVRSCQPVIFQGAARTTTSLNLPLRRLRKNAGLPKPLHD